MYFGYHYLHCLVETLCCIREECNLLSCDSNPTVIKGFYGIASPLGHHTYLRELDVRLETPLHMREFQSYFLLLKMHLVERLNNYTH